MGSVEAVVTEWRVRSQRQAAEIGWQEALDAPPTWTTGGGVVCEPDKLQSAVVGRMVRCLA
jgi:hypothetical protein